MVQPTRASPGLTWSTSQVVPWRACWTWTVADIPDRSRVATSFPRLTERYFAAAGKAITVVPVSGACEIAPHLGIADVVVDLTSTGSTLKMNGLREVATVIESTARLISTTVKQDAARTQGLSELSAALASVLRARGKRYLMANVPKVNLAKVRAVLPGLNGPTVVDVMDSGTMVAVHAVVPANGVYRTISSLKALGAEGILVTRIERLMP
jgi:ATP phosphoribosyltransferase